MKKGVISSVSLALFLLGGAAAFAQPSVRSVETIVIDSFDTDGAQNYQVPGKKADSPGKVYNWTWGTQASRFVAEGYPKQNFFDGIPNSLRPLRKDGDPDAKVLGVQVAFNRKGDNWFEVFPVGSETDENGNAKALEIPFVGTVSHIDFWVWGANYRYYLEVMVRDADGRVHVLPAGNLVFQGWRNVVVNIPTYIRQHSRLRSGPETLAFVGFRIRSDMNEFVDDFQIFFDQLRYTTNTMSNIYDGYDLRQIFVEEENDNGGNN